MHIFFYVLVFVDTTYSLLWTTSNFITHKTPQYLYSIFEFRFYKQINHVWKVLEVLLPECPPTWPLSQYPLSVHRSWPVVHTLVSPFPMDFHISATHQVPQPINFKVKIINKHVTLSDYQRISKNLFASLTVQHWYKYTDIMQICIH